MQILWRLLFIAYYCLGITACSYEHTSPRRLSPDITLKSVTSMQETKSLDEIKRLSVEDLLSIKVYKVPELTRKVRIDNYGDISFPLIGSIHAKGLTVRELELLMEERLGERYIQNPQVSVFVQEYVNQRVTIEGVVKKPGIFPLKGKTSLLQAIASADGPDDTFSLGDQHQVHLYRNVEGGKKDLYVYDLDAIRRGQINDPLVMNNDVIIIPKDPMRSRMKAVGDAVRNIVYFTVGTQIPLFGN